MRPVFLTMKRNPPRGRAAGFTLTELIFVIMIAAILLAVGTPSLSAFVAEQRVRTAASDFVGDIAFARANAIQYSRRVHIAHLGTGWNKGYRIYVDLNDSNSYDAGEELKIFNGYPATGVYLCTAVDDFADELVLRPDGRIVRATSAAVTSNDGFYLIDDAGGTVASNKIRAVLFGLSGRATVINQDGTAAPCARG